MKILLTGASGLLGSYLRPRLLARGHSLVCVSRNPAAGQQDSACRYLCKDLLKDTLSREELSADVLVHLAWITTPGEYWTSRDNTRWADRSLALIDSFVANGGQRVVVGGSCAEYRWDNSICVEGATPTQPTSPYAQAKVRLYESLQRGAAAPAVIWSRIFFPYGPGEAPGRLLPQVLGPMIRGDTVRCSEGTQQRDYIHAADIAEALVTLAELPEANGSYNICSATAVSIRDIVQRCLTITGSASEVEFGAIDGPANDVSRVVGSNARLRELGWQPRISLEEGLHAYHQQLLQRSA